MEKEVILNAAPGCVWSALTDPTTLKNWVMGLEVTSDWVKGGSIVWRGSIGGRDVTHIGTVLEVMPGMMLRFTDFGSELGLKDIPENYTRITYYLQPDGSGTRLKVTEDHFNGDRKRCEDAEVFWGSVLKDLKKLVEQLKSLS